MDPAMNFAKSVVSQGYDASATSIVLESTDQNLSEWGDPASVGAYNAVWWDATNYPDPADDPNREIVRVTALNVATLTVTRAQESTTATAKNTSGSTYKMAVCPTKKLVDDLISAQVDAGSAYAWVTDAPYSAEGDGSTDDYDAFNDALTAGITHLIVPSGTYRIASDLTVPAGVTLLLLQDANFSVDATKTLTINGTILFGNWTISSGSGSVDVSAARNMASTAPSSGTWKVGDIVWNSAPATTEYIGWVCVTAPNTFLGFGAIA